MDWSKLSASDVQGSEIVRVTEDRVIALVAEYLTSLGFEKVDPLSVSMQAGSDGSVWAEYVILKN